MISKDLRGCSFSMINCRSKRSSKTSLGRPKTNLKWRSRRFAATTERSSRTQMWTPFLMKKGFHTSSRLRTHLNKMELLRGRTGRSSKWREWCLMSRRHRSSFGQKRLRQLVMQQITCIFTSYSARRHTSSSPVTNPKLDTFEYLAQSATFLISIVILTLRLSLMKVSY